MIRHIICHIGDNDDLVDDDADDEDDDDDDDGKVLCNGEFLRATKMWDVKHPAANVHCTQSS